VSTETRFAKSGADDQDRTGDLVLTKDVLCQLSYIGPAVLLSVERETGIEPATNSLEGCDSTTELLPQFPSAVLAVHVFFGGEGRTRTFEGARPTDLQSAAFDRFATSPMRCVDLTSLRQLAGLSRLAEGAKAEAGEGI
jgi:hypothetical protein